MPHAFLVLGEDIQAVAEMEDWCEEQFGERHDGGRWDRDLFHFYFASVDAAMLFRLRW